MVPAVLAPREAANFRKHTGKIEFFLTKSANKFQTISTAYDASSASSAFASLKIARVEPFGEPRINRSKQFARFPHPWSR
jgi:hypothetical protein